MMKRMTKVEEYSSQIPLIVRRAFKALGSDNGCAIVVVLYGKQLTLDQLADTLELDLYELKESLKELRNGGIVTHYTEVERGKKDRSYYEITDFGMNLLKAIIKTIIPQSI